MALRSPLTFTSLMLSSIGLVLSVYLTYVHYNLDALVCGTGGCELVQSSEYSEMFGVPIALFGTIMFATLITAIVLREFRVHLADVLSTGILMILVAAIVYWVYLTWLELNVIHAVCQWCVATSIVTALLCVVEAYRWYQGYSHIGSE